MHQKGIYQEKIIDVLNTRFLLNQTQFKIVNENIQVHFPTKFLIKQD